MIDWKKVRAGLLAGAGAYLIYIAYSLFCERKTDTVMPLWVNCMFSGLFALAALAIFLYAYKTWKKAVAEEKAIEEAIALEKMEEKAQEDGDAAPASADGEKDRAD